MDRNGRSDVGMTYIRPCVTEAGKVSAETHLVPGVEDKESSYGFLDSSKLCWLLNLSEVFSSIKCSQNLGIAKMEFAGKTIVVSKAGRINIRTAESEEDALKTTWLVSRALWPAMICSKCRRAILECVSGICGRCKSSDCSLLVTGPPNPTHMFNDKWNTKTVPEIFSELTANESSDFNAINDLLQSVVGFFNEVISVSSSANALKDVEASIKRELEQANRLAQKLIVQSQRQMEMSAGLVLLGIISNLGILGQALSSLVRFDLSDSERLILKRSWCAIVEQCEAMWEFGLTQHRKRKRPHSSLSALGRANGSGRDVDFRKNLERVIEVSKRFSRTAKLSLAA
jgi:hypothetical protein